MWPMQRIHGYVIPAGGQHYYPCIVCGMQLASLCGAADSVKQAVVVGGGYIGLEVAAGMSLQGLDVTMVFPEEFLVSKTHPQAGGG